MVFHSRPTIVLFPGISSGARRSPASRVLTRQKSSREKLARFLRLYIFNAAYIGHPTGMKQS